MQLTEPVQDAPGLVELAQSERRRDLHLAIERIVGIPLQQSRDVAASQAKLIFENQALGAAEVVDVAVGFTPSAVKLINPTAADSGIYVIGGAQLETVADVAASCAGDVAQACGYPCPDG